MDTEQRYSNIERELLGAVFGLERLHHYTFGHSIMVETDHQPLTSIWKILLRLAQYDVHIEYLRGKENVIADALSWVTPLKPEFRDYNTIPTNIKKIPIHQITQTAPARPGRLQEFREATKNDSTLQLLAQTVYEGWPKTIQDCPCSIQLYWYFRDEIMYEDGILYKGTRLIIPETERKATLSVLHMGHYALNKMNLRARETVYWPGISEVIKITYQRCIICAKFTRTVQKETLKPTETPLHSWDKLGLDIFQLKGVHYLLTVDYFSQFPVLWKLSTLHSQSIINNLKQIFTEIGVPRSIITDGSTQLTSQEFKDFMQTWNIEHRVTSPTNAQSNGQAEWFVQTIKNSLTKAMEGGEDPHLALLAYITTPLMHNLPSPAELLNSRKFRCLLPVQIEQHKQTRQQRQMMQRMKLWQAKHYNKNARLTETKHWWYSLHSTKTKHKKMDPRDHHPYKTREFKNIQCPDHTWRMVHRKQKILQSKAYKQSTTYNTKCQVCTPISSTSMTKQIQDQDTQ